jgi:glycine dehydrogenase subunit 2
MCGYDVCEVKSTERGTVDVDDLREKMNDEVAGLMLTNPNTFGVFEDEIQEMAKIVHDGGGLLYYDGANLNAFLGQCRPGDTGFDVVHINLHKTFTTPHGGGGPGSGPVGVKDILKPYLPTPLVVKEDDTYRLDFDRPESIGKVSTFWGNFGMVVRAFVYSKMLGGEGMRRTSEMAVLNANYVVRKLQDVFERPKQAQPMHEGVLSAIGQKKASGVGALDIAKRLIDYGIHPPTIYFPLPRVCPEALLIEPTETESLEQLDVFVDTMRKIAEEAESNPELLKNAPHDTPVRRVDEATAARSPILRWTAK